jgi:hypothetical protein
MLSIKRARTYERARRLADLKGVSITDAVESAIEAALAAEEENRKPADRIAKAKLLVHGLKSHFKEPNLAIRHGELLYDEHGAPK